MFDWIRIWEKWPEQSKFYLNILLEVSREIIFVLNLSYKQADSEKANRDIFPLCTERNQ